MGEIGNDQSIIAFGIKNARNGREDGEREREREVANKDRVATMIQGMEKKGKQKRDGSIGQRAGRMCEYPSDVCSQRWPHSRRLAPHGRRTESGKHGRESISHKIPTSRHRPFGYLCRFFLHRVHASSFFFLFSFSLYTALEESEGRKRISRRKKWLVTDFNRRERSEIGKSRTTREKKGGGKGRKRNRLVKIDRYFALFYFRRTKLFFKENANSFLPRWKA